MTALVPLSHIKQPKNSLVVGLGAGATVDLLSRCGVPVKVVEIEEKVAQAVDLIFDGQSPLDRDDVTLSVDDARHHLKVQSIREAGQYDLITSMPSHPWVAPSLFTREFFSLARENLSDRGVFSTWFAVHQNMDSPDILSLVGAFTSVFDHYLIYHVAEANAMFLVGSKTSLQVSPDYLAQLTQHDAFSHNRLASDWSFLPSHIIGSGNATVPERDYPQINTDNSLFIELNAPRRKRQLSSARFQQLCATPYLLPEMLESNSPQGHFLELFEAMLGTPGGVIPDRGQAVRLAHAEQSIAGAAKLFSRDELAYLGGRLAVARGQFQRSVALLDQVPQAHPLRSRAEKFAALAGPEAMRDVTKLSQLPYSRDIAIEIAAIDLDQVPEVPAAATDPLLAIFDRARKDISTPDDRETFLDMVPDLIRSRRLGRLRIGQSVAAAFGLPRVANMLLTTHGQLLAEQHKGYLANGDLALRGKRYADAVMWYKAARQVGPLNFQIFQRMRLCYLQLGRPEQVAILLESPELRGQADQWRALIENNEQKTGP